MKENNKMDDVEKLSYALGMNVAGNITELPIELDFKQVIAAINDVSSGKEPALELDEYHKYMQQFQQKVQEAGRAAAAKAAEANVKAGKDFLEANKAKEGVKVTASGLQYKVLQEGSGAKPSQSDKVRVHYTGKLIDGNVFDSSVQRGEPAEFGVTQVIPGWVEGLQLMNVGSKFEFVIPHELAYGERG
ncbi:MAG: FKBP-type peptidyl-prolyl cis-trans isomerase, partial [Lentisphaeria bacterium]|nr:FKBP-type peptidyl-prolyl cis-trans isomerase [Lentisphaeria bacterium]